MHAFVGYWDLRACTHAVADTAGTGDEVSARVVEHLASLLSLVVRVHDAPGQSAHTRIAYLKYKYIGKYMILSVTPLGVHL